MRFGWGRGAGYRTLRVPGTGWPVVVSRSGDLSTRSERLRRPHRRIGSRRILSRASRAATCRSAKPLAHSARVPTWVGLTYCQPGSTSRIPGWRGRIIRPAGGRRHPAASRRTHRRRSSSARTAEGNPGRRAATAWRSRNAATPAADSDDPCPRLGAWPGARSASVAAGVSAFHKTAGSGRSLTTHTMRRSGTSSANTVVGTGSPWMR